MTKEELTIKCIIVYLNTIRENNILLTTLTEEIKELERILLVLQEDLTSYHNNDDLLEVLNLKI